MLAIDRAFSRSEELLCQIHDAIREGNEALTEELNDELTAVAASLSSQRQTWLNGLSADLYSLSGQEARFPVTLLDLSADLPPQEILMQAVADRDWEMVLRVLRSSELSLTQDKRAYLRGESYEALDMALSPGIFYAEAVRLAPEKAAYRYLQMSWLAGHQPEAARAIARYEVKSPTADLAVAALAAWILLREGIESREEISGELVTTAASRLTGVPVLGRLSGHPPEVVASTLLIGGYLFELLELEKAAESFYRRAISLDPQSLEARELLRGWGRPDGLRSESQSVRAVEATHKQLRSELAYAFAL